MRFVTIDLETTGLSPLKGGRIIEIGAVKVEDGKIIDRLSTFVNPELKIPKKISDLTSITNEMVANSPTIWTVLSQLWDFIQGYTVVAHNAKFDWDTYLKPAFEKIGKHPNNAVVCSLKKSRKIYGMKRTLSDGTVEKVSNKLEDICKRNNVELVGAHRAVNDCEALSLCLLEMIKKYPQEFKELELEDGIALDSRRTSNVDFIIHSVNYWESPVDKKYNNPLRRFYVSLVPEQTTLLETYYPGTVFYDIGSKTWRNKDFLYNTDYSVIEKRVLEHEKVATLKELYEKKTKAKVG